LTCAYASDAFAQKSPLVGAWTCDAYVSSAHSAAQITIQGNPVFASNGGFSDDSVFVVTQGNRDALVHVAVKGTWTFDEDTSRLEYVLAEATATSVSVDGVQVDPAPLQERVAKLSNLPSGFRVRLGGSVFTIEWDQQSVVCRRRSDGELS